MVFKNTLSKKKSKSNNVCCTSLDEDIDSDMDIVLVGNPNTGKSSLFNHITGVGAVVSNCCGTTVNFIVGKTKFDDMYFSVVDLPGSYAICESSEDEKVTKEIILKKNPKLIINVIDSTLLERNLYLTLQLLKLRIPVIVALNFYDDAKKKGMLIDKDELSKLLGVTVIEVDALRGKGVEELMKQSVQVINNKKKNVKNKKRNSDFTEKDNLSAKLSKKRHDKASLISKKVVKNERTKEEVTNRLERITTDPVSGTLILILVFSVIFSSLFFFGNYLSAVVDKYFSLLVGNPLKTIFLNLPSEFIKTIIYYSIDGINAGMQIALPYILVFYILMAVLEDSGYLPRIAYLLDRVMHRFKLHGKAIVPMLLGFGCSVPAILATRVMPSKKERILTTILITLIPCSARTAVILGATGKFIGWEYALLIYLIILTLIIITAYVLSKSLKGEVTGLILEMPPYRMPSIRNVLNNTWIRLKEFVYIAFPLIVMGSAVLGALISIKILPLLVKPFEFIMTSWLFLPAVTAIPLIYGVLRKELALEMLLLVAGTFMLTDFMTPLQIFTFSLVVALYFPCIATFAVLKHEFGLKISFVMAISTSILAIFVSGVIARIIMYFKLLA